MWKMHYFQHLVGALPWLRFPDASARSHFISVMDETANFLKAKGFQDEDAIVDQAEAIIAHACGHFQGWRVMDQAHVDSARDWSPIPHIGPPRPEWLRPLWQALEGATASDPYLAQAVGQYFSGLAHLELEA